MLLALVVTATAAPPPQATPRDISRTVAILAALDRARPLNRAAVAGILGSHLRCRNYWCDGSAKVGRLTIGHVDFRSGRSSYVLVLDQLGGICLPMAPFAQRFKATHTDNACTDGAVCLYTHADTDRGELGLRLSEQPALAGCLGQIVFNSDVPR